MEADVVQSVSQLTDTIKYKLNDEFDDVWVSGEISGLSTPQSGHIYLTLKDPYAQVSGIIWRSTAERLRFTPENGMQVLCRGYIDVYPQRGTFQLIVRNIQPLGQGALQIAFRKLHDRLKAEGLFDESLKIPIPTYPRRIAVITSPTGAAIHDFLQVATRRWPHFDILIVPTKVQGDGAANQIARAIQLCSQKKFSFGPEVIVITRGGGSIEDLWAFNEEAVVRAIHKSSVPVISAVGHEVDVSLSDLAADLRALTPSEAGEILAPELGEVNNVLRHSALRINQAMRNSLDRSHSKLELITNRPSIRQPLHRLRNLSLQIDSLDTKLVQMSRRRFESTRQYLDHCLEILTMKLRDMVPQARHQLARILDKPVVAKPLQPINAFRSQLDLLREKLDLAIKAKIDSNRNSVAHAEEMLNAFNPDNILNRGYSLTVDSTGKPVVDCENIKSGDKIVTWLQQGKVTSTVDSTSPNSSFNQDGQEKN